jgi:predicted O-methyltransferase YrrM
VFLAKLKFTEEFIDFVNAEEISDDVDCFKIDNQSFAKGDSDFLYQLIRHTRPSRIFEIGSGYSTKVTQQAISMNRKHEGVDCQHTCFEPYEQP